MKIQTETLFVHDNNGKMTFVNDPTEPATRLAPRFFLGITTSGFVYRFRHDLPLLLTTQLEELIQSKQPPNNLKKTTIDTADIEDLLNTHKPIERIWNGPTYYFPKPLSVSPNVVRADKNNAHLFNATFPEMIVELDDIQPCMAYVVEGNAVSVCQTVRRSSRADEAGLDTLEKYRGQGYGPLAAAGWAEKIKAEGKIPFYSTSWKNQSSQRVAEKLGLVQFGIDFHIT